MAGRLSLLGAGRQTPPASGGWWLAGGIPSSACVVAYQAKGAASYAASKVNLANPGTYDLVKVGSEIPWDITNGWKFPTAIANSLSTGYAPGATPTMIFRFSNSIGNEIGMGVYAAGKLFYLMPNYPATGYFGFGAGENTCNGLMTEGVAANAAGKLYKDGSYVKTQSGTLSGAGIIYIGHPNGVSGTGTIYIQAAAIYDSQLSDTQNMNLRNAMVAL